jgi:hypothetical protein
MIRNHWDAIVSWWHFKGQDLVDDFITEMWLETLIEDNPLYFKPPYMWYFLQEIPNIIVLRYENYDHDVAKLFDRFDLEWHDIKPIKDEKYKRDRNYRRYFDIGAEKILYKYFGEEIERLGYQWKNVRNKN